MYTLKPFAHIFFYVQIQPAQLTLTERNINRFFLSSSHGISLEERLLRHTARKTFQFLQTVNIKRSQFKKNRQNAASRQFRTQSENADNAETNSVIESPCEAYKI